MWIERDFEDSLGAIAGEKPALVLTGARQTGKTSLASRVFPDHTYVSLDVPAVAEAAEHSGEFFLQQHPAPLIIDEVQYAPGLLRYLKAAIDRDRERQGQYVISGSQHFPLMQGVSESLAGRCSVTRLHTLSALEIERFWGTPLEREALIRCMFLGGYPELHARALDPERFYRDYLVTYLERDVRSMLNVRNLRDFDRLIRLCAARTGQLLSFSSLAADVGITPSTAKAWISVLEASGVIALLEPYHGNLGKRLIKTPKLYFLDTGLACHLTGMREPRDLEQSTLLGAMFETHVHGQLVRRHANQGRRAQLYFFRDHYGHEVDFVLPRGGRLELIECKWSETPRPEHRGFDELRRLAGDDNIISRTFVTPRRGQRSLGNGVFVGDGVEVGEKM
ncbi:MAG: ATP-binding protein [Pseudomonadota bacterium]